MLNFRPENIVLAAIFLLVALPFHEFSHAFVAWRLGDATAKLFGRLTLNPIVHFDPIGGSILALTIISGSPFAFGWAKPTPVNSNNLRDRRNGEVLVALAGPLSNLLMAALGAAVWRILDATGTLRPPIDELIFFFVYINVILAVFNMIPIPPLDGSALLFRIVSPSTAWQIRPVLAQYGGLLLLAVIVLMWSTPLGDAVGDVIYGITKLLLGL